MNIDHVANFIYLKENKYFLFFFCRPYLKKKKFIFEFGKEKYIHYFLEVTIIGSKIIIIIIYRKLKTWEKNVWKKNFKRK